MVLVTVWRWPFVDDDDRQWSQVVNHLWQIPTGNDEFANSNRINTIHITIEDLTVMAQPPYNTLINDKLS